MSNTTNYVIELLISGICAMIWILLLSLVQIGNWLPLRFNDFSLGEGVFVFLFLFPIAYIIGVIMDRIVDNLFDFAIKNKLRDEYFKDQYEYRKAKTFVYMKSDAFRDLIEYGQMRIRICRNWLFNGVMILIFGIIFIQHDNIYIDDEIINKLTAFHTIAISLSLVFAYKSWQSLLRKDFQYLKIQYKMLNDYGSTNQSSQDNDQTAKNNDKEGNFNYDKLDISDPKSDQ